MRLLRRFVVGLVLVASVSPSYAVIGDLNRDGKVDFGDFFLFADNFGESGPPEEPDTIRVTLTDTVERVRRDTAWLHDTLFVAVHDTVRTVVHDTVFVSVHDTVFITIRDTVYAVPPEGEQQVIHIDQDRYSAYDGLITIDSEWKLDAKDGTFRMTWTNTSSYEVRLCYYLELQDSDTFLVEEYRPDQFTIGPGCYHKYYMRIVAGGTTETSGTFRVSYPERIAKMRVKVSYAN